MENIKFLLALYLVQLNSFASNTLGKQMKEYAKNNRIFQHIINIIYIFVLISFVDSTRTINNITVSSIGVYLVYLLSTKLDLQFNLLMMGLILIYYFYTRELENKKNRLNNDNELDNTIKNNIITFDKYKYNIAGIGIFSILIYLVYIYGMRKNIQYGGGFSYVKFLLY